MRAGFEEGDFQAHARAADGRDGASGGTAVDHQVIGGRRRLGQTGESAGKEQ